MKILPTICVFTGIVLVIGAPVLIRDGELQVRSSASLSRRLSHAIDEGRIMGTRDSIVPAFFPVERSTEVSAYINPDPIVDVVVEPIVEVKVPVPQPYPVEVVKHIDRPVPVPQPYPVVGSSVHIGTSNPRSLPMPLANIRRA
ncbi:hypothetical protein RhiXN_08873 [Rhizoctonia solani]|uniref:Uncharacterized protein n=1 Tax=Rhizoctonia solani TaxID=456999 RepID=A0A8H8NX09_9AGAM|nr:uncharacterized protein RhiXN_08873 [Rhizoctonia solani]QRW19898.1 hypothetical protein RhiXN_08873 [Rhizoctonia solani]